MNKYVLLMTMVFFLVIITMLVGSINLTTASDVADITISEDTPGFLNILRTVWNYVSLFFRIIFFAVPGIPAIFNILVFYPLTAGTIYMLVDIIRGNG